MYDHSTFPPALAAEPPAADPLGRPLGAVRWAAIGQWFHLPSTLQGYLIFLLCLLILAFTMVLHVTLSAEIMRLNVRLYALQNEHELVERHNANTMWLIAQRSSLSDAFKVAQEKDYTSAIGVKYVVPPLEEAAPDVVEPQMSHIAGVGGSTSPWWQQAWDWTGDALDGLAQWWHARTGW